MTSRKVKKRQVSKSVTLRKKRDGIFQETRAAASTSSHQVRLARIGVGRVRSAGEKSTDRAPGAIEIGGIECSVHIGVDEEERATRQRVAIDVALEGISATDSTPALRPNAESWVRRYLESGRFVLIEAASLGLARVLFEKTSAQRVFVRFYKFVLPEVEYVAIEMAFDRKEAAAAGKSRSHPQAGQPE